MRKHRALLGGLVLGLALLSAACKSNTVSAPPVPAGGLPDGGFGRGPPVDIDGGKDGVNINTELTTFVRDLITYQTADDNLSTTTEDKPLVDTAPEDAFPSAFFQ